MVVAALAAGCGSDLKTASSSFPSPPPSAGTDDAGPVVEVVPVRTTPPLDPMANPTTPLGELRARYLPVWSSDFDWAFPPEVCGSAWALDAIAEPVSGADLAVLGDVVAAAALSVMRYEHLVSRALAEPDVLAQLCVAVATVGSARTDALEVLASYLGTGARSAEPSAYPDGVTVVATSPTVMLAVACLTPGYPGVVTGDGGILHDPPAPVALQAYLLAVSRGLEDSVTDISYRVSNITHRPAEGCDELGSWAVEWERQAEDWSAQGEVWGAVGRAITADQLCDTPPSDGPDECPRDW